MDRRLLLFFIISVFMSSCESQATTDSVRAILKPLIENINPNNAIYGLKDTYGKAMQCTKVIQTSVSSYVAVYHYPNNSDFTVGIANSTDLIHWNQRSILELGSSQPTVYAIGTSGTYFMAWEQTHNGGNRIRIRYFTSLLDLMKDHSDYTIEISPPSWVAGSIGTPNIFSASVSSVGSPLTSTLIIGAHYYNGQRDRQTSFILTNWNTNNIQWLQNPHTYFESIEDSVLYWLFIFRTNPAFPAGNIGGRDPFKHPSYTQYDYAIIEGNPSGTGVDSTDFKYWKCFLYDRQTKNSDYLNFNSQCGATAFANPHISIINLPNNGPKVVFTSLFIPSEGKGSCQIDTVTYFNYI